MRRTKKSSKDNRRVRNTEKDLSKLNFNGVQFKSQLEVYCCKKLVENEIEVQYEKLSFTLMDAFEYKGKKLKAMTYTPDFTGEDFIIETKGYETDVFTLKWKLFKNYLVQHSLDYDLYMPKNHKEVDECILKIKEKRDGVSKSKEKVSTRRSKSLLAWLV